MEYINVEIAYATPEKQIIIVLKTASTTSVADVVRLSNIQQHFPQLTHLFEDISLLHIGIFGKKINPQTYKLQPDDRIEIYRPLAKTPNQRRLERAKNAK